MRTIHLAPVHSSMKVRPDDVPTVMQSDGEEAWTRTVRGMS